MNCVKPFKTCSRPSSKFLLVLILTLVLSQTSLTNCTTLRQSQTQTQSLSQTNSHSQSLSQTKSHTFDTIHIIERETLWLPPDSLGLQYPLRTTQKQIGSSRQTNSQRIAEHRDTVYLSSQTQTHTQSKTQPQPLYQSHTFPWLIILLVLLLAIIIIFLIKH